MGLKQMHEREESEFGERNCGIGLRKERKRVCERGSDSVCVFVCMCFVCVCVHMFVCLSVHVFVLVCLTMNMYK